MGLEKKEEGREEWKEREKIKWPCQSESGEGGEEGSQAGGQS
jgi:hypothetical protein